MKYFLILLCTLISCSLFAQSPIGIWKNIDDEDGEAKSHIEIYQENGKLSAKVVKLLVDAPVTTCTKCKDHRKDKPLVGMIIMNDLEKSGDSWDGGEILDPKSGKSYKCTIKLSNKNELDVRGYIGVPLFGRSQTWYRVET